MSAVTTTLIAVAVLLVSVPSNVWSSQEPQKYTNYQLLQVVPETDKQLDTLRKFHHDRDVVFWKPPTDVNHAATFIVAPDKVQEVRESLSPDKASVKLLHANIQRLIEEEKESNTRRGSFASSAEPRTNLNRYLSLHEYFEFMKDINSSYPNMEVVTYGKSYEDRDLMAVKVYKDYCNPTIFIEAGVHAREWIGIAVSLKIIKYMAENSSQDPELAKILDRYNWVIAPLVNPDGYEYAYKKDRLWRKNRNPVSENCIGVDINRNFNISWGTGDSSRDPCRETYCGSEPLSEPETRSLRNLIKSSHPLIAYISLHSFSQMIMTPYSYTEKQPDDYRELLEVAKDVQRVIKNLTGFYYQVGRTANIMYKVGGCSTDWVKAVLGVKYVYAIELRPTLNTGSFILPISEIEPSAMEMLAALKAFANRFDQTVYYSSDHFKKCKQKFQ